LIKSRSDREWLRLDHLPDFELGGRAQSVLGRRKSAFPASGDSPD